MASYVARDSHFCFLHASCVRSLLPTAVSLWSLLHSLVVVILFYFSLRLYSLFANTYYCAVVCAYDVYASFTFCFVYVHYVNFFDMI